MQQPIKDLQYFKDEVARENGYSSFEDFDDRSTFEYDHNTPTMIDVIANRYAAHREQQAKDASRHKWIMIDEVTPASGEWLIAYAPTGRHIAWHNNGIWTDRNGIDITGVTHWMFIPEKPSPYREKGGEDELHQSS